VPSRLLIPRLILPRQKPLPPPRLPLTRVPPHLLSPRLRLPRQQQLPRPCLPPTRVPSRLLIPRLRLPRQKQHLPLLRLLLTRVPPHLLNRKACKGGGCGLHH